MKVKLLVSMAGPTRKVWCKPDQRYITANVSSCASQEAAQRKPDGVLRFKQCGGSLLELPLRCDTVGESVGLLYCNWR